MVHHFRARGIRGSVEEAIIREVREEANALSEVVRLIGVYSSPEYTTYHYDDRIVQYVVSYFEVKLLSSIPPNFKNEETEQFKYFPIGALPADLDLINPHWLTDALRGASGAFIR